LITKYRISFDNKTVDFLSSQEAVDYLSSNGIQSDIQVISEQIIVQTQSEIELELSKKKRIFGRYLSDEFTDMIGTRNKINGLTTAQVISVLTSLGGLAALLERGALGTVRDQLRPLVAGNVYPVYTDIFQHGIDDINEFEAENGL
jgi:hypothetical protein